MSIVPFIMLDSQRRMLNNDYEHQRRSKSYTTAKHIFKCEHCGFEFEKENNIVATSCPNCRRITNWYSNCASNSDS